MKRLVCLFSTFCFLLCSVFAAAEPLQSVIDRGVIVPKAAYVLDAPLLLRSNVTITFEPGTTVDAAEGAFKGVDDSLIQIVGVENVSIQAEGCTFKMRKADYRDPLKYKVSEFRHALDIRGSKNVFITGGTYCDSGGDGIFLGPLITDNAAFPNGKKHAPNEAVTIRRVTCDNNHRQGVSVVACVGCTIEDSLVTRTNGTSPQAGIDIEPEFQDPIDVAVRRCRSEGNRGPAFMWSLQHTTTALAPVRIMMEACTYGGVPADQPPLRLTGIFNGSNVTPTGYLCPNIPAGSVLQWNDLIWKK